MTHTTIFQQLGKSLDELTKDHGDRFRWRSFGIDILEQPDGDPIVGIGYHCDAKAEEEWGVGDLRNAFTTSDKRRFNMTKNAKDNVAVFSDVNGLVLSTGPVEEANPEWGHPFGYGRRTPGYVDHFNTDTTDIHEFFHLRDHKVPELRGLAKAEGIKPLPARKEELIYAILGVRNEGQQRDSWPGWFQSGRQLILRADNGLVADALAAIAAAATSGNLAIGNGGGVFHSGIFLYDHRDESKQLKVDREAAFDWYDAQMAELKPVAEKVAADIGYYALGNPSERQDDAGNSTVEYWLNSHTTRKAHDGRQIYGWFTLQELEDGSYIDKFNASKK